MRRDLVVIGTSSGGIEALQKIVAPLTLDFPAAIAVVLHTSAESLGILDAILERAGHLPVRVVRTPTPIVPATIYVPALDHHLIVEPSVFRVARGPKENRFRPAIDPLFRSAAQVHGPRVIGIILTGDLGDGAAGLWAIKRMGGTTIVQDPQDALFDSMPRNALEHLVPDFCVPLAQVPALLQRLTSESIAEASGYVAPKEMQIEVGIAADTASSAAGIGHIAAPSSFACPECHGVLFELAENGRTRFRCHTGHAYSADALVAAYDESIEDALWNSARATQEQKFLLERLAEHVAKRHDPQRAVRLRARADAMAQRMDAVHRLIVTMQADSAAAVSASEASAPAEKRNRSRN